MYDLWIGCDSAFYQIHTHPHLTVKRKYIEIRNQNFRKSTFECVIGKNILYTFQLKIQTT